MIWRRRTLQVLNSSNILYLPSWLRTLIAVVLGFLSVLGALLFVDSLTYKWTSAPSTSALSFIQIIVPSFVAFVVVAYGRKQMSMRSIDRSIGRFIAGDLAAAIDVSRAEKGDRVAKRKGGPYLRHIAFVGGTKGAEYAIDYKGKMTWARVWFDLLEFVVLLRIPHSADDESDDRKEAYTADLKDKLDYWTKRYEDKSWRIKFRSTIRGINNDTSIDYIEIWCIRKVTNEFLYDTLEQAIVVHEIAAIIRGFLGDCHRLGIEYSVDATWLPEEHRRIKRPYTGRNVAD